MKKIIKASKIFLLLVLLLITNILFVTKTQAGRNITLPFIDNFDINNYEDLQWLSNGASINYEISGGWSGGAVKITPPTSAPGGNGEYGGLGSYDFSATPVVHVRFLVKFGSDYITSVRAGGGNTQNKFVILNPDGDGTRGILSLLQVDSDYSIGPCDNSTCKYECGQGSDPNMGDWWPDGNDAFLMSEHLNEWIAMEYKVDLTNGLTSVYIWTLDETLGGLYKSYTMPIGGNIVALQILGGYFNGYHVAGSNVFVMFDEMRISNNFIGPPVNFLDGDSDAPLSPSGLSVL